MVLRSLFDRMRCERSRIEVIDVECKVMLQSHVAGCTGCVCVTSSPLCVLWRVSLSSRLFACCSVVATLSVARRAVITADPEHAVE